MKKWIYLLVILTACCTSKLLQFDQYDNEEGGIREKLNGSKYTFLAKTFIVKNYTDCKNSETQIDSFVNAQKKIWKHIDNINLTFYKSSKKTNLENWKTNPRDIDRYSNEHDLIYSFIISESVDPRKSVSKFKYRNGKTIEPKSNIIIIDAPPQ